MGRPVTRSAFCLLLALAFAIPAAAEEDEFEVGPRWTVVTAGGEPANDMSGFGAFFRYRLKPKWFLGVAVDLMGGDFERPYAIVGLDSPREIDSTIDSTTVSVWAERQYGKPAKKLRWFWVTGLGYTSPDIDDVSGPVTGGGTFDITTEADAEAIVMIGGGLRRPFGKHWKWEAAAKIEHHFADWTLTDRSSGQTGTIDDYTPRGFQFAVTYGF